MVKNDLFKGAGEGSIVLLVADQLLAGGQLLAAFFGFLASQPETLLGIVGIARGRLAPEIGFLSTSLLAEIATALAIVVILYRLHSLVEGFMERRSDDG